MRLLIDFDGTIVEHKFPAIGSALPHAFEVLKELKAEGHQLILWTCREDFGDNISRRFLTDAVNFCRDNGLEFDAVNETLMDYDFRQGEKCKCRKPHVQCCIDDTNLGCCDENGDFLGWKWVREMLVEKGFLPK